MERKGESCEASSLALSRHKRSSQQIVTVVSGWLRSMRFQLKQAATQVAASSLPPPPSLADRLAVCAELLTGQLALVEYWTNT